MKQVGVYKLYEQASSPTLATTGSACFDVSACLVNGERVHFTTSYNEQLARMVMDNKISLFSGERALIPTGLIFDIPHGYSIRIHPRSGLSYKRGISLGNCEAVIDSDYVDQTYISLINHSDVTVVLDHGDRVAQLELVKTEPTLFVPLLQAPITQSSRTGGFGSTGLSS